MKVSVVIPTYNRAEELRRTLDSLGRISFAQPWEVLVVDNNSTDATRSVVMDAQRTFPVECRYLLAKEQGRYAAMNSGIAAASGEIIASTDDDARPEPEWL